MKLSTVAQNNKGISLAGERLVVVGGTQGIGEGVACRFAEAGAEVWIVGRNEGKAKGVLERLRASSAAQKIDPPPEHAFFQADLSLVSEARRLSEELRTRAGSRGIDYLVMTQGGPPNGKFVPTSEGHEQHYGVQVLSRFVIAHELAADPAASTIKKGVMSVMSPGRMYGKKFDPDDIGLHKANKGGTYGMFVAGCRDSVVVDSFTQDLAAGNPNVNFTHVFPGFVKTDYASNSDIPRYLSLAVSALSLVVSSATPRQYADVPFYLLAHPDGRKLAAQNMFTNEKLTKMEPYARIRDDHAIRDKIRSHLADIVGSKQ